APPSPWLAVVRGPSAPLRARAGPDADATVPDRSRAGGRAALRGLGGRGDRGLCGSLPRLRGRGPPEDGTASANHRADPCPALTDADPPAIPARGSRWAARCHLTWAAACAPRPADGRRQDHDRRGDDPWGGAAGAEGALCRPPQGTHRSGEPEARPIRGAPWRHHGGPSAVASDHACPGGVGADTRA